MRYLLLWILPIVAGCAEESVQGYAGPAKPESDVSIIRLWTPTTTNIFTSPGLLVLTIDGKDAGSNGRTSHAYVLPGEHELQIHYIQVHDYNLLCGALCDAIFNKPRSIKASTQAGHTYTVRYVGDEKGSVVLDDRGEHYDPVCLRARTFKNGQNC
jgi:hypothetical protein